MEASWQPTAPATARGHSHARNHGHGHGPAGLAASCRPTATATGRGHSHGRSHGHGLGPAGLPASWWSGYFTLGRRLAPPTVCPKTSGPEIFGQWDLPGSPCSPVRRPTSRGRPGFPDLMVPVTGTKRRQKESTELHHNCLITHSSGYPPDHRLRIPGSSTLTSYCEFTRFPRGFSVLF